MWLRASGLDDWVTLQAPTRTADGAGGYTETWAALTAPSRVPARIRPATATQVERTVGGKMAGALSYLVEIRYHAGVSLTTRAIWGTKTLQVRGIEADERRGSMVLACEELV